MKILPIEKQHKIKDEITKNRIDNIMPQVMKETGIDMWLILAAEYNEDPVFKTIVPGANANAARLTCIVFSIDKSGNYEAVSINKPNASLARFYKQLPYNTDTQWETIKAYITKKNPSKIGVNISDVCSLGAGLSYSLYKELKENIGGRFFKKVVSAEPLSVRWMEYRTEEELAMYSHVYEVTTGIMARAFSKEVITPGVTTTQDVQFWAADQFRALGLGVCFPPTVNLQRKGCTDNTMITGTIRHGDLLHYDAGIEYLGLCTDLQRLAYVLHPHEDAVPKGILAGFNKGQEFGRIASRHFISHRTGNEVFKGALKDASDKKIEAMFYTHPIGFYCHGAGPTIGLYDKQEDIPGRGDRKLNKNTCYALEYNVACPVEEWGGQKVYFYLEETVMFIEDGRLEFLDRDYGKVMII